MPAHVTRVVMHTRGLTKLATDPGVHADLASRAERVRDAAQEVAGEFPAIETRDDTVTRGASSRWGIRRVRVAVVAFGSQSAGGRSSAARVLLSGLDAAR